MFFKDVETSQLICFANNSIYKIIVSLNNGIYGNNDVENWELLKLM